MKLAFIGGGNMASALIGGLLKHGQHATEILVIERQAAARAHLTSQFGVRADEAMSPALAAAEAIILAVKPQDLQAVVVNLHPFLSGQLLISIAAGIPASAICQWLGGYGRIVRAMPNTPALIGAGITGMLALPEVSSVEKSRANSILASVGQTLWFEKEAELDAVTAISGSGPAYVFYFMEILTKSALQLGLNPDQALQLVLATFTGASQLAAQSSEAPEILRARVTSPNGTTAAALASMENAHVRQSIELAVQAAYQRALEIADNIGR